MKSLQSYYGLVGRNAMNVTAQNKLDAFVPQNEIVALYDKWAGVWDVWSRLIETRARARAVYLAAVGDGQSYLDAAVGTGLTFREVVRRNPNGENIGIDLSEGMLALARQRLLPVKGAHYELQKGSPFALPAHGASIDVLMSCFLFDRIPFAWMDTLLAEFRRVLKSDGKLIMAHMTEAPYIFAKGYEIIYHLAPKAVGARRGVCLSERLVQNGFQVERREYVQQLLFPMEIIRAYL
ncbi:MAG TPA: methyltransferase domain-containing protein [Deltaproteobacteria bacterium]|nr:methyltransferase domain-containing protein [Deltaproteobacteria bacterium]